MSVEAMNLKRAALRIAPAALLAACSLYAANACATPRIQHWQAPSGAQVYFVEDHSLPMLDVAVNFHAGSGFDAPDKSGLAALTQGMLDHGADGLSEDAISRKLADIGAELNGNFDQDRAGVSLRTLSSAAERDQALDVLARLLQHPAFPEKIVAREKERAIAALKEAATKPEAIAEKAFARAVYGSHPYGLQQNGEVETVGKLRRADILAFYRAHYSANSAVVALMGDLTREQAEAIAQKLTAQLPAGGASTAIPPVTLQIKGGEQRIVHPATQSHILIGAPGISRTDPDYFTLYVGNYVLGGGGFVSRLMDEVREKRGMAYSIYSYFMPMQQPGAFQIGLQTKKEQADEALGMVRTTLRQFIQEGPSEKELQAAKDNIVGGFPLRIDSNRKILDYLSVIGFYGLPLTYLDDFTGKVDKVTVAQIRDAFRRRVNPDALVTVMVGAPEAKRESGK
ncbi:MAG TPA: pitrilysin family protein [Gallionellaceae bacterium]